ncbi:MAG: hypothetical protein JO349_06540 [Candidatus Eremiobacteraeota bacterium]|nr:hypothetical protein [Candidatus Eremiobacteraeota bacterium]MBV8583088.1 hypothetical protein [Candidatus Eremiobacteraeota bacterium]
MTTDVQTPPIEQLGVEFVASLCMAGLAYLAKDDLESATIACDIVGLAFDRLSTRLGAEEKTGLSQLVTELRMSIVTKRGAS